jgi:2-dehydro-3-deoxyphosphogluconate aldolase/(4S)-4-hydroxy-2-oxoglutarate aldolase
MVLLQMCGVQPPFKDGIVSSGLCPVARSQKFSIATIRHSNRIRVVTDQESLQTMKRIFQQRIVPVAVVQDPAFAVPLAEALSAGGLTLIEFTFRTAAAAECIAKIRKALPSMLVGAGTVLTPEHLQAAVDAGAQFGVAPGLNETVVARARELGLPFIPGVMTPSDVERGLTLGCSLLKFFPAEAAGGIKMLKALAGPYAHTGVKFVPTGGIAQANLADYLALPMVAAVGGSWMVEGKLLAEKNWAKITALTAEAVAIVAKSAP